MQTFDSHPIVKHLLILVLGLAAVVFVCVKISYFFIRKMSSTSAQPFPWSKRLGAVALLVLIILFSTYLGYLLTSQSFF